MTAECVRHGYAVTNSNASLDPHVFRLHTRWMFDKTILFPSRGCDSQPLDGRKKGLKGRIRRKPLMNWLLNRLGDPRTIRKIVPTEVLIAVRAMQFTVYKGKTGTRSFGAMLRGGRVALAGNPLFKLNCSL